MSKFIAGGCSFTFGHELSDQKGKLPSKNTWAHKLFKKSAIGDEYLCVAKAGAGNSAIARRVFQAVANATRIDCVAVMWSFVPRYDWAMPPHRFLEDSRQYVVITNMTYVDVMKKNEQACDRAKQGHSEFILLHFDDFMRKKY
mgnify:CR=1 FL=1